MNVYIIYHNNLIATGIKHLLTPLSEQVTLVQPNNLHKIEEYFEGLFDNIILVHHEFASRLPELVAQKTLIIILYDSSTTNKPQNYPSIDLALSEEISTRFLKDFSDIVSLEKKASATNSKLSQREIEIVQLIASGHTTQTIAERLFLSPHTVQTHRKNILKKLGLHSAAEIANYAWKKGLVKL